MWVPATDISGMGLNINTFSGDVLGCQQVVRASWSDDARKGPTRNALITRTICHPSRTSLHAHNLLTRAPPTPRSSGRSPGAASGAAPPFRRRPTSWSPATASSASSPASRPRTRASRSRPPRIRSGRPPPLCSTTASPTWCVERGRSADWGKAAGSNLDHYTDHSTRELTYPP